MSSALAYIFARICPLPLGVEIRTQRLMNVTHPERLGVGENGLIPERRVEKKLPCSQHAKPLREPWALPDHILVQLQTKTPGREPRGRVHQIIGIIPLSRREPHPAGRGEPPVLRLIVLILEPAKAIPEAGIRPVLHAAKPQALH